MSSAIRIVLVEPSHPGNIGAAARAMKTMGLSNLYLVNPVLFPHADASARAAGADDILARAQVCTSLDQALIGCKFTVGASARARRLSVPVAEPRECAARVQAESAYGEVAVLFGRERSGLTNAETDRCHLLVSIPTVADFASLNLGAAVQVLAYELALARRDESAPPQQGVTQTAPAEDMRRFYEHLERVLVDLDFLDPERPKQLMRRLRLLFNRARPDDVELNILRGILTATERARANR